MLYIRNQNIKITLLSSAVIPISNTAAVIFSISVEDKLAITFSSETILFAAKVAALPKNPPPVFATTLAATALSVFVSRFRYQK